MGVDILLEENATAQVIDVAHEGFFCLTIPRRFITF